MTVAVGTLQDNAKQSYRTTAIPGETAVAVVNPDGTAISGGASSEDSSAILKSSDLDLVENYTLVSGKYRLDSIVYSSIIVGKTMTETYTWADFGTKNERITHIVRVIV